MGSFNMACAVTNLPIQYGEDCVLIEVENDGDGFDMIHSHFYPVDYPIFGKYDDYGRLDRGPEVDKEKSMFIHRFAWDNVMEAVTANREYWAKAQKEYSPNKESFSDKKIRELKENLAKMQERQDLNLAHDDDGLIKHLVLKSVVRTQIESLVRNDGSHTGMVHWRDRINDAEDVIAEYEKYNASLGALESGRHLFNYQIRPSYYAGQEVHKKALAKMTNDVNAWLRKEH